MGRTRVNIALLGAICIGVLVAYVGWDIKTHGPIRAAQAAQLQQQFDAKLDEDMADINLAIVRYRAAHQQLPQRWEDFQPYLSDPKGFHDAWYPDRSKQEHYAGLITDPEALLNYESRGSGVSEFVYVYCPLKEAGTHRTFGFVILMYYRAPLERMYQGIVTHQGDLEVFRVGE